MSTRHLRNRHNRWVRTGGRCWYCGEDTPAPERSLDHVVPRSNGGTDLRQNRVPCCKPCNTRKANLTLEQFREAEAYRTNWPFRSPYPFAFELEEWS